jgi:hypothetical protein
VALNKKQAEAMTHAMSDIFEENLSNSIFTKQDGRLIDNKLDKICLEINSKMSKLETRIVIWFVGLLFVQNALFFGLFKLIH